MQHFLMKKASAGSRPQISSPLAVIAVLLLTEHLPMSVSMAIALVLPRKFLALMLGATAVLSN